MPSGHLPVVTQFVPYMHICYGTRHLLQEGHKLNRAGLSPSLVLARKKVSAQQQQQHPAAAAACFGFSMAWDGWQSVAGEPVSRGDAGHWPLAGYGRHFGELESFSGAAVGDGLAAAASK